MFLSAVTCGARGYTPKSPACLPANEGYLGIFDEKASLRLPLIRISAAPRCDPTTAEVLERHCYAAVVDNERWRRWAHITAGSYSTTTRSVAWQTMTRAAYEKLKPYHPKKRGGIILSGYGYRNSGRRRVLGVIVNAIRNEQPDVAIAALSRDAALNRQAVWNRVCGGSIYQHHLAYGAPSRL